VPVPLESHSLGPGGVLLPVDQAGGTERVARVARAQHRSLSRRRVTSWLYGCSRRTERSWDPASGPATRRSKGRRQLSASSAANDGNIDTTVITEIAEYFRNDCTVQIPEATLVGRTSTHPRRRPWRTDTQNEEIYNVFNTEKILKRPVTLALTDKAGWPGSPCGPEEHRKTGSSARDEGRSGLGSGSTTG